MLACMQANAGPWVRLAEETGALVKWWRVSDTPPFSTSLSDLKKLLSDKTKIVAFPHVSNLLGEVVDVAAAVKMIRAGPAGQLTINLPVLL
jgi:selenocysteine lyase/cysteine desulfurase